MKYEYKIAVHKSNQAECGEEAETGLCVTLEEKQCDTVELRECLEVEEQNRRAEIVINVSSTVLN